MTDAIHLHAKCASHPNAPGRPNTSEAQHECLRDEMRCAYCGIRLHPYPCNGCGRFLTAREMHENESRCDDCI